MQNTQDIVIAMQIRSLHNKHHNIAMVVCTPQCQRANQTIEEDNRIKQKGVGSG